MVCATFVPFAEQMFPRSRLILNTAKLRAAMIRATSTTDDCHPLLDAPHPPGANAKNSPLRTAHCTTSGPEPPLRYDTSASGDAPTSSWCSMYG